MQASGTTGGQRNARDTGAKQSRVRRCRLDRRTLLRLDNTGYVGDRDDVAR
jgi:hypothetical protein